MLVFFFSVSLGKAIAQHNAPDTISTIRIDKIEFDGKLVDSIWLSAGSVSNFTQRELDFGKPATEPTKVFVVYDDLALFIGV